MRASSNAGFAVSTATPGTFKDRSLRIAASALAALVLVLSANAFAQSTLTFVGSSLNPSTVGASVTFSASVNASSMPNGTVNFTNGGTSIPGCSASILVGNGTTKNAYCTTTALPAGTHSIVGIYSGDGINAPSTSPAISQVVNGGGVPGSTTAIASSLNPAAFGASVTFTATVTGSAPSGTVNFTRGGTSISGCSARPLSSSGNARTATCTTTTIPVGTHTIAAAYSGDGSNGPSTSAGLSQVVTPAGTTTALASSLNPAAVGASVTLTASVTGSAPTGTVNFVDGGSSIGGCSARTLSGTGNTRTATCTTSSLSGGTHSIVASYGGNASNASSTSAALAQVVNAPASTTTLSSSVNPSIVGNSVTFTATVVGTSPTGTVNFRDVGTSISGCSARSLSGGGNTRTATCTTSSLAIGTHSVVASYSGNNAASSSGALSQSVTSGGPSPTPNFVDVPPGDQVHTAVRAIAYHQVTVGCASNPMRFCPSGNVGRDEMAVFLERVLRGFGYPFAPTGTRFSDVPITHWAVGSIEQLYSDGVTLGCGSSPLRYCPDSKVTRAEMAIFLLRARHGATFNPGAATGLVFADVPASHWAAAWIERFAGFGYTAGCSSAPLEFCPDDLVSRAQMALFLQRVFNLIGPP